MNDAMDAGAMFRQRLEGVAADIERLLAELLGDTPLKDERARPQRLMDAMRYVSLAGGKRLRPFLVVETAALLKAPRERALMAGAALEFVHCYSLAHDDLPAMDNDDLRRGRPTAHKAFDEATAILAGDGLLTLAFDILARPETHPNPAVRAELVLALARMAGLGGMVGGQMLDLAAEGRFDGTVKTLDAAGLVGPTTSRVTANLSGTLPAPVRTLDVADMVDAIKVKALENEVARLEKLKAQDDARAKAAASDRKGATEDASRQALERQQAEAAAAKAAADAAARVKHIPQRDTVELQGGQPSVVGCGRIEAEQLTGDRPERIAWIGVVLARRQ